MSKARQHPTPMQEPATPPAAAPAPRKRPRPGEPELQARRSDLVAAARKLLRKGGSAAVTMRAVAQMVGMSTTVVYALFPDKAALITQALDDDLKRFSRHLQQALQNSHDASDALERVAQAYVAFGLAHPQSYRLMFMEQRRSMPLDNMAGEHDNPRRRAYDLACTLATNLLLQQNGAQPSADTVDVAAHILWEALHGITALRVTLDEDPWLSRVSAADNVRQLVQVLRAGLAGLGPPGATPPRAPDRAP